MSNPHRKLPKTILVHSSILRQMELLNILYNNVYSLRYKKKIYLVVIYRQLRIEVSKRGGGEVHTLNSQITDFDLRFAFKKVKFVGKGVRAPL